jgi:hypothetical protein
MEKRKSKKPRKAEARETEVSVRHFSSVKFELFAFRAPKERRTEVT